MVQGEVGQVCDPLSQVTLYPVIADPLLPGVDQFRFAPWFVMVAETFAGASGVVAGVTLSEAIDRDDSPISFRATTWNA
jgi:hypothetical protein